MISKPTTAKDALMMSARAAVKREVAINMDERGDYHASWERAEADEMDTAAADFLNLRSHAQDVIGPLPPKPGNGGELLMVTARCRLTFLGWSTPCANGPPCWRPRLQKAG
jgi:hypothetical protein